ncbi:MAG: SocA family protein [Planctomycetaceae bacterium]|jgi:hypothetical protein|nr:SocA family protein [Planctomycetaceae bacterium]
MENELLTDIIIYICMNYPHKDDLSDARLTKMIYLADWKYALKYEQKLTNIEWVFNHYGPYVADVIKCAENCQDISIEYSKNTFNSPKTIIKINKNSKIPNLNKNITETLDFIIEKAQKRNWKQFIQLVYSTYPILTQERYTKLDLVKLAKEYQDKIQKENWDNIDLQ